MSTLLRVSLRPSAVALLALLLVAPARAASAADGLALVQEIANGVGGVTGLNGARALALSADGAHLYVASDSSSSVTVFGRSSTTGALTYLGRVKDGVDGVDGLDRVRALALSPDGTSLYAAADRDDALAVFQRDPATGTLAYLEVQRDGVDGVDGLDGARGVAVSPDGAHVYVAGGLDNAVALFSRDPETGGLTFVELQRDGENGANGLNGAEGLALAPDGLYLYVASPGDDSLATYRRDPATGSLAYVGRAKHDTALVDGLDGVRSVVVSPDGANVYAGGKLDDAIAVFTRDPATGILTFVNRLRDAVDGVDGLDGVESLAFSPAGDHLYAAASTDSTVAVFQRDPGTGVLTFLQLQRDGVGTIDALGGAKAVVASADGLSVYVAAGGDDAVTVFGTGCGDSILGPGEQCDDGNADAGDGCSPGCRLECGAPADCDDGDACTEDRCRAGECAMARCGFIGGVCELSDASTTMQAASACLPIARPLGRTIRFNLNAARHMVLRARHQHLSAQSLTSRVTKTLSTIETKLDKLQQRGLISPDCMSALVDGTELLRLELTATLQRKGVCGS